MDCYRSWAAVSPSSGSFTWASPRYMPTSSVIQSRNRTFQGLAMQSTLDPAMRIPVVYNDAVVRRFAIMTVIWGIVGMLVGVVIAAELIWPNLDFGLAFLSYGRLRPL